jgi:outer membrane protein TolC
MSYEIAEAEYELALLQYESNIASAETPGERTSAELARLSALNSYQSSLRSYYYEVIDAVFNMAVAELGLEAALLNDEIAKTDLAYAQARFENGLISESDLRDAELYYREDQNYLTQARFDKAEARSALMLITGFAWNRSLLPGEPEEPVMISPDAWLRTDIGYQKAILARDQAERDADNPAGTVSAYEQRQAEIELESAIMNLQRMRNAVESEYRSTQRALESSRISLDIKGERFELKQQLLRDAEARLERGLITSSGRDQQAVSLIQAEMQYLEALRQYTKDTIAYSIRVGQ